MSNSGSNLRWGATIDPLIPSLQYLIVGKSGRERGLPLSGSSVRGPASRAESNGGRSGGCFVRPKQWVSGFFGPFTFDALGSLSNLPRSWSRAPGADRKIDAPDVEVQACQRYSVPGLYCIELERRLRRGGRSARREFQRLGVNLPLQGRRGPGDKEGGDDSEGARLKSADVGVGRFGLIRGPSAALGRVVPEEALFPETRFGRSRKRVPRGSLSKQVPEGSLREAVKRREPRGTTLFDDERRSG